MTTNMVLSFSLATDADAEDVQRVRAAAAEHLTAVHGRGPWSSVASVNGVLFGMRYAKVLQVRDGDALVATLRLATRKPWTMDEDMFTAVPRPLYLMDMAVLPDHQRQGVGRIALLEAARLAREWPADALRLDAYQGPAGAGPFYQRSGYRCVGKNEFRGVPYEYYELELTSSSRPNE